MNEPRIFYDLDEVIKSKVKYILSIGKRQPMHIGHKKSLERIIDIKDTTLIYVMGSVNVAGDPLFDPFTNPLNISQQIEQFKRAFPNQKVIFLPILDVVNMSEWGPSITLSLKELGIKPHDCAIHFIGKPEDRLTKSSKFFLSSGKEITLEPGRWLIEAIGYYDIAIWFDKDVAVDFSLSARNLRNMDLTSSQKSLLVTPEYLLEIASQSRNSSSTGPITLHDLSLHRLKLTLP